MKTFTYTARDLSGATVKGTLNAADRQAALAELKSRNQLPTTLEEGGRSPSPSGPGAGPRWPVIALAGALLLLTLVWVVPRLSSDKKPGRATAAPKKPVAAKVVKPSPAPAPKARTESPKPVEPPAPVVQAAPPAPVEPSVELPVALPPRTNSLALRPPGGPRVLVPGLRRADTNAPNPYATFKTKSERMMSQMLDTKPGERIVGVGFGRDFDKDFLAALDNTIEIYPTDTPEMAAHKEDVAWMKEEMKKLVLAGKSPEEILTTFRDEHNQVADLRTELQRQLIALKKDGKLKEAEEFAAEANKILEPYGTRPLTVVPVLPKKK